MRYVHCADQLMHAAVEGSQDAGWWRLGRAKRRGQGDLWESGEYKRDQLSLASREEKAGAVLEINHDLKFTVQYCQDCQNSFTTNQRQLKNLVLFMQYESHCGLST